MLREKDKSYKTYLSSPTPGKTSIVDVRNVHHVRQESKEDAKVKGVSTPTHVKNAKRLEEPVFTLEKHPGPFSRELLTILQPRKGQMKIIQWSSIIWSGMMATVADTTSNLSGNITQPCHAKFMKQ